MRGLFHACVNKAANIIIDSNGNKWHAFFYFIFISNDNNERIKKIWSNSKSHYLLKILIFEERLEKKKRLRFASILSLFLLFLVSNIILKVWRFWGSTRDAFPSSCIKWFHSFVCRLWGLMVLVPFYDAYVHQPKH